MNATQTNPPDPRMRMVNALLLAGGIFVTWKVGRNLLKQINKDSQQLQVDDSPAVRQAMTLRSALNLHIPVKLTTLFRSKLTTLIAGEN